MRKASTHTRPLVVLIALAFSVGVGAAGCKRKAGGGADAAADDAKLGTVACWGLGRSGQMGNGKNEDRNPPSRVDGVDDATKLSLASVMSCARVPAGMRCWGDMREGAPSNVPKPFALVADAEAIGAATLFACALRKSGGIKCWGSNLVGQLGNGKAPDPKKPIKLAVKGTKGGGIDIKPIDPLPAGAENNAPGDVTGITDATALAVGGSHACALRRDGTVMCWGSNTVGQLGDGKSGYNETSDRPVEVVGLKGAQGISAGTQGTCARTADAVWCWGSLTEKYPSDGTKAVAQPTPTKVEGIGNVAEIALSETRACARTADGEVKCWGAKGEVASRAKQAVQLAAGENHHCARLQSGALKCWGNNNLGQLGVPDDDHDTPETVPGVTNVIDVAAGSGHTCVIRKAK